MLYTSDELKNLGDESLLQVASYFLHSRLKFYLQFPMFMPEDEQEKIRRYRWHYVEDDIYKAGVEFGIYADDDHKMFLAIVDMMVHRDLPLDYSALVKELVDIFSIPVKFVCKSQSEEDYFSDKFSEEVDFIKIFE